MTSYFDAMSCLARRLMPVFATALGLPPDFFDDKFDRPTALLRPLKYAAAASNPLEGVMAAGAHSDYGRGGHSSTSQLNLSRSWSLKPQQDPTDQMNLKRFCH